MSEIYVTLGSRAIPLDELNEEELAVLQNLRQKQDAGFSWGDFDLFSEAAITKLYRMQGKMDMAERRELPLGRIARDMSARIAIATGKAKLPDYRDELAHIIRVAFGSASDFCRATGLDEDKVRALLGRYVHPFTSYELSSGLEKIGFRLGLAPIQKVAPIPEKDIPRRPAVKIDLKSASSVRLPDDEIRKMEERKARFVGKDYPGMLALIEETIGLGYRLTVLSDKESVIVRRER